MNQSTLHECFYLTDKVKYRMTKIEKIVKIKINGIDEVEKKCDELSEKIKEARELLNSLTSTELTLTAEPEE